MRVIAVVLAFHSSTGTVDAHRAPQAAAIQSAPLFEQPCVELGIHSGFVATLVFPQVDSEACPQTRVQGQVV